MTTHHMRRNYFSLLLIAFVLPLSLHSQDRERADRWLRNCQDNNGRDRGVQFCELRDVSMRTANMISVDGRDNGGVAFYGSARTDVSVIALIQVHADNDADARDLASQIRVIADGGQIRAEGPSTRRRTSWSVSYQISVPRRSNLQANTMNGGITAESVEGRMSFRGTNGGIRLNDVAGDVEAETTNGGVSATLTGTSWIGKGLDLRTVNGGVNLVVPRNYNARLITGTVNGGMRVDFPVTVQGNLGRNVETQLGNGGTTIRATTTNGGVRISQR